VASVCVCALIEALPTRLEVLILQHPQEQDMLLGSAGLTVRCLARGMLKVGLSWPSLSAALGRETNATQWAVLYPAKPPDASRGEAGAAGAGKTNEGNKKARITGPAMARSSRSKPGTSKASGSELGTGSTSSQEPGTASHLAVVAPTDILSRPPPAPPRAFSCTMGRFNADCDPSTLRGIVVLDGTWSQAKTLWWRNPWLLKCARVSLNGLEPSIYGKLRKQPKRHCLSTLEAVADALVGLGEAPTVRLTLRRIFRTFVQRVRDASAP
jgi:DTW domain-containing protein YfiP